VIGTKILEQKDSKYNGTVTVIKSWGYGTYLQVGGLTQSGGVVETIWKQTLRKVKNQKSKIKSCLILGLGGGTVAKIIADLWPESEITGVEIDPLMVEFGKKYLDLNENRLKIVIGDASKKIPGKFDLVIVDLYTGDNYPEKFEEDKYLDLIRNSLEEGGMVVFNRLYYGDKIDRADNFEKKLKNTFSSVTHFYPSANIMFFCTG
jgi:spermidine synthase